MRTQEEINAEITKLEALKHKVPDINYFGESNVEKIETQIRVLRDQMSEEEIEEEGFSESMQESAMYAWEWMNEETNESLSEDWAPLAK